MNILCTVHRCVTFVHTSVLQLCRSLCRQVGQALRYTGKLGTMASEEEDMPVNAALSLEAVHCDSYKKHASMKLLRRNSGKLGNVD